jgi:signal transduction histidine kinase/CheY-like chemotaxis protein
VGEARAARFVRLRGPMSSNHRLLQRSKLVATGAGALAGAMGLISLLGWLLADDRLKGLGGQVTMKANTAVGLCLLATSTLVVLLYPSSKPLLRVARAASTLVVALGAVTLSQHLFGWDVGLDQLLFREAAGAAATASPGRMGPPACFAFILLGTASLMIDRRTARSHSPAQWLALSALPLPVLAILGYVTGATQLYGIAEYTGIALHSAIAFVSLALALLLARPELQPAALLVADDAGGEVARSMLPVAIFLPLLLTRLRLAAESAGLFDASFGRAITLLALLGSFTFIIWRTAQRLSSEATKRQRLEGQRAELLESERAARHEAERAAKLKDEFLATLSHELRTPLNAILGWVTILRRAPTRPAELERPLEVIERSACVQAQLIDDLLDIASIVSGKLRLHRDLVDLASVADAALQAVLPAAEAKHITVEVDLAPELPAIAGDASRLQQVLWNLLSNAVKFTPNAGKVELSVRRLDDRVELRVSDTGSGIPAEFLPHIFDRFRQADSSITRPHGGLGLGLSIVRQLVELHGGTVSVSSQGPKRGSTFLVSLPVSAEDEGLVAQPSAPPLSDSALSGLKIMVVDDELDSRELMGRVLTECGASVRLVASADEALAELEREPADVLVSDIGMPGKDGYELMRAVRTRTSAMVMPAVAVTAFARADDRSRALAAGFQMHISKPVNASGLLVALGALTGRTGSSRQVATPSQPRQDRLGVTTPAN